MSRIDDARNTPLRINSNLSTTRTTPKTSFGDRVRKGLGRGGPADLSAAMEEIVSAVMDAEAYVRLHSPTLLSALVSVRSQLQGIAIRSKPTASQTTATPVAGSSTHPKP